MRKNVPTLAGCHLATHPKSRSCGSKGICLLIFHLFVLETSQYPSCLCLEEVSLFVRLDGKHPSSGYVIPRFDLPQSNKIENFTINRGLTFPVFCFSKMIVLSFYFLSWGFFSCTGSPVCFKSCSLFAGCHTLFQHISSLTTKSLWYLNLYITWSTSLILEPRSWPVKEWWLFYSNSTGCCPLVCGFCTVCAFQWFSGWEIWETLDINVVFSIVVHVNNSFSKRHRS